MNNRINSLVVVLKKDLSEEDAIEMCNAISLLKGIISVKYNVTDMATETAEKRARYKLQKKLWDIVKD